MKKLTLILFASLLFFTTASYAENEELIAQVAEVQSKLKALQESNNDLKNTLASYENEIAGWRLALENLEAEIAAMEEE
jgi:peptidoglycan hydrolase CwlO-like protein